MEAFVPTGPVLLGLDDTIERRRGKRVAAGVKLTQAPFEI